MSIRSAIAGAAATVLVGGGVFLAVAASNAQGQPEPTETPVEDVYTGPYVYWQAPEPLGDVTRPEPEPEPEPTTKPEAPAPAPEKEKPVSEPKSDPRPNDEPSPRTEQPAPSDSDRGNPSDYEPGSGNLDRNNGDSRP